MEVNGRDVRFFRSVLANCEIADASPDGDVNRLLKDQLTEGNYATSQRAAVVIIMALSKGYEIARHVKEPAYKPRPITEEEAMSLTGPEFNALFDEAIQEFYSGGRRTVEPEPENEKKTENEEAGASG